MSLLTPIHFHVPSFIFGPPVAKYLAENGVSRTFWKTIGSTHFIPGIYPSGMSFFTPKHCRVPGLIFGPLVAKYLAENWVPGTFWKKKQLLAEIHFISGICPYGMSLLSPIHFRVPSLIFGPLVAKYLAENAISGGFFKILVPSITCLAFTLRGWVSWPLYIFVFLASFSSLWWPNIWSKWGFRNFLKKIIGSIHFIPGFYPYGWVSLPLFIFVLTISGWGG